MVQIHPTREHLYPVVVGVLLIGLLTVTVLAVDAVLVRQLVLVFCSIALLMKRPELALAIQINGITLYLYTIYKFNIETGTLVTGLFYGVMASSYLLGGWLLRRRGQAFQAHLIDKIFLLLYSEFLISYLLWSRDNPFATRKVLYAPVLVIAPYLGVRLLPSLEKVERFLQFLGLMPVLMILPSFYELGTNPIYDEYGRFSIYIFEEKGDNPIQFGIAYALLLILVVFRIARDRRVGWGNLLLLLPAAFLLLRSGARGPVISLLVTFLLYILWLDQIRRRVKVTILAGGAAILLVAYSAIPDATMRFYEALYDPSVSPTINTGANSIQERMQLIEMAIGDFVEHPLLGVGTGNSSGGAGYPHNSILEVAAELGLVGLLIFLSLHAMVALTAYRSIQLTRGKPTAWVVHTSFAIYLFAFVESQFSGHMGGDMLLYVSIGLVAVVGSLLRQEEERRKGNGLAWQGIGLRGEVG
jgi:O-antigen ligase